MVGRLEDLVLRYERRVDEIYSDLSELKDMAKIVLKFEDESTLEKIKRKLWRIIPEITLTTILTMRLDIGLGIAAADLLIDYLREYRHDRKKVKIILGEILFKKYASRIYKAIRMYNSIRDIINGREEIYSEEFKIFYKNTGKLLEIIKFVLPYLESKRESEEELELREAFHNIKEYLHEKKGIYKKLKKREYYIPDISRAYVSPTSARALIWQDLFQR